MSDIKVPALGESVTEATVGSWHKKTGDQVKKDDLLVELETDKITLEVNAEADGVLESIVAAEGANVEIGDKLGVVKDGAIVQQAPTTTEEEEKKESPQETQEPVESSAPAAPTKEKRIPSPAAAKIAAESNINLASIIGTGREGRITKGDVLSTPADQNFVGSSSVSRETETVKMTKLRQKIAERLKESQNTAAILTTFNEVDMTNVMNLRNRFKDSFLEKHQVKLGFMSFFVKAAVAALQDIPAVNALINGNEITYHKYCDISIAVGTEKGLVVPVLRNAEKLSFAGIESGISALAKKARDNKLTIEDLTGGTFSITNGGVYGSLLSTPIINPPQSAILGMHSINKKPVVVGEEIKIRPMMYLALSYDHRIIDGKEAVTFLVKLKDLIENPEKLLFEI